MSFGCYLWLLVSESLRARVILDKKLRMMRNDIGIHLLGYVRCRSMSLACPPPVVPADMSV
jgi:hypothetical protein